MAPKAPQAGLPVGLATELGRFTFTADEIVRFARLYDPQPLHVDAAAAGRGPYGGLIASGWHTVCVWMGLFVRAHGPLQLAEAEAPEIISPVGVGFGLRDLRWVAPVRAGDEVVFSTVLDGARASASRPGWSVLHRRGLASRPDGAGVARFALSHLAPTAAAVEVTQAAMRAGPTPPG